MATLVLSASLTVTARAEECARDAGLSELERGVSELARGLEPPVHVLIPAGTPNDLLTQVQELAAAGEPGSTALPSRPARALERRLVSILREHGTVRLVLETPQSGLFYILALERCVPGRPVLCPRIEEWIASSAPRCSEPSAIPVENRWDECYSGTLSMTRLSAVRLARPASCCRIEERFMGIRSALRGTLQVLRGDALGFEGLRALAYREVDALGMAIPRCRSIECTRLGSPVPSGAFAASGLSLDLTSPTLFSVSGTIDTSVDQRVYAAFLLMEDLHVYLVPDYAYARLADGSRVDGPAFIPESQWDDSGEYGIFPVGYDARARLIRFIERQGYAFDEVTRRWVRSGPPEEVDPSEPTLPDLFLGPN